MSVADTLRVLPRELRMPVRQAAARYGSQLDGIFYEDALAMATYAVYSIVTRDGHCDPALAYQVARNKTIDAFRSYGGRKDSPNAKKRAEITMPLSLDYLYGHASSSDIFGPSTSGGIDEVDAVLLYESIIKWVSAHMTPNHVRVVEMLARGSKQAEIAECLGVTEARISQLRRAVRERYTASHS